MELPILPFKIPEVQIPFEIPVLMHPVVDHFAISLPIIVLLLEIINLFTKKRAIGVVSFFLLSLTVAVLGAAYLTGLVDGKEAFNFLSQTGQEELKAHKLLGIYLMLASTAVLLFKLLSVMISRGMMKGLYLLLLIMLVVGILKQGKDGGELVYLHGANVKIVKTLDDEMFDTKEELEELKEELEELKEESKSIATKAVEVVKKEVAKIKEDINLSKENISNKVDVVETVIEENVEEVEEVEQAIGTKIEEASDSISKVVIPENIKKEITLDANAS